MRSCYVRCQQTLTARNVKHAAQRGVPLDLVAVVVKVGELVVRLVRQ